MVAALSGVRGTRIGSNRKKNDSNSSMSVDIGAGTVCPARQLGGRRIKSD